MWNECVGCKVLMATGPHRQKETAKQAEEAGQTNQVSIEDLDKFMASVTDTALLKEARISGERESWPSVSTCGRSVEV